MQFCNYLINSFQFKRTLIFLFIFLIIKKPYSKKFWLRFLFEMMLQVLNHAVLQTLQKIIWKDIYVLQDDLVNKALPFAKLNPWVCWWIWIFLSFLRKFHVKDFIPIGTLCWVQNFFLSVKFCTCVFYYINFWKHSSFLSVKFGLSHFCLDFFRIWLCSKKKFGT